MVDHRPGTINDNARIESFFQSLKAEGVHGARFTDDGSLRGFLSSYVQFYNDRRAHSALGYRTPAAFERECVGQLGVKWSGGTSRTTLAFRLLEGRR